MPSLTDDSAPMTSLKQASRHQIHNRSQTPEPPSATPDIRTGSISLHVDGEPDAIRPFLDFSSQVAICFKPKIKIIEKAALSSSSINTKTSSKRSSSASTSSSTPTLPSTPTSSSSSSTLSSGSKQETNSHHKNEIHSSKSDSGTSTYLKSGSPNCLAENNSISQNGTPSNIFPDCFQNSAYPAYTVTVFLRQMDADPSERLKPNATPRDKRASSLFQHLTSDPWRIHHVEHIDKSKVKFKGKGESAVGGSVHKISNFNNSKNTPVGNPITFYSVSPKLPLWSVRHVHHGCEHVRIVLNTPYHLWDDQIKFYSIVLGFDPDLIRDDFCLFTIRKDPNLNYDIQLALKRLPENISVSILKTSHVQIKIKDLGKLVALLPNVCQPISDVLWETTDHLGNKVVFKVLRHKQQRRGSLCLEDAVYECMTLPIIHSLNNTNKILQQVEEHSKCTQTSPITCNSDGGDENRNKSKNNDVANDIGDSYHSCGGSGEGDKDTNCGIRNNDITRTCKRRSSKSSVQNPTRIMNNKCDIEVVEDDNERDDSVYENCFVAKYDDLEVYMNCDNIQNSSNSYNRVMCNPSSSNSISAITCRVKPSIRNSPLTSDVNKVNNCDKIKKDGEIQFPNYLRHSSESPDRKNTANDRNNTRHALSNTVDPHSVALKHCDTDNSNDCDSNGYVVLNSIVRGATNKDSRGFPILLTDDDIQVEFHRSFSNGDDETCPTIESIGKALQEDEESLTLTNLSEESGIIVLHDDDGIWCEGEIEGEGRAENPEHGQGHNTEVIKPCLRKHGGSGNKPIMTSSYRSSDPTSDATNRNGQNGNSTSSRKVRFSDEIRSFELEPILDDSQSRLSSGFESDEQSDDAADRMLINRKYRHRHHHHQSSTCSSRTFSKNVLRSPIQYVDYDDTVATSYRNGLDSSHHESTSKISRYVEDKSKPTNIDDSNGDVNNHYYQPPRQRGRSLQKFHSDKVPSSSVSSSQSVDNMKSVISRGRNYTSSHPVSPGVLFRPICPPSYEVALATKRKIQQEAMMKKKKNSNLCQNIDDNKSHHRQQHQPPHSEYKSNVIDNDYKTDNQSSLEFQPNVPNGSECNIENKSNLYEKSKKLHSNQRANFVCNNTDTEIHHAVRVENSNEIPPNPQHSTCKYETHTSTERPTGDINSRQSDTQSGTQSIQSTSNPKQDLYSTSKAAHNLVGILRTSKSNPKNQTIPIAVNFKDNVTATGNQNEDITTNFTLRFDTCPTSGGQPRKEQTGFYV